MQELLAARQKTAGTRYHYLFMEEPLSRDISGILFPHHQLTATTSTMTAQPFLSSPTTITNTSKAALVLLLSSFWIQSLKLFPAMAMTPSSKTSTSSTNNSRPQPPPPPSRLGLAKAFEVYPVQNRHWLRTRAKRST